MIDYLVLDVVFLLPILIYKTTKEYNLCVTKMFLLLSGTIFTIATPMMIAMLSLLCQDL